MEEVLPLRLSGKCVVDDDTLFANIAAAEALGLPEVLKQSKPHTRMIAIVASGPSVGTQVEKIRQFKNAGIPIVAVKDAHDWLQDRGIMPDYAFAIDPQEHRWNCFKKKNAAIKYMIASQCHPAMFEHLSDMDVTLLHLYVKQGQEKLTPKLLIGGGTTSGLRAITLFYVLGYRHFALFGFDSCLDGSHLRVNGDHLKLGDGIIEVKIDPNGETFFCNRNMALQAEHFQLYFDAIPDAQYYPFGEGLIPAILRRRESNGLILQNIMDGPKEKNERVSFIHWGDKTSASWRYRADIPARGLGASLNDMTADTLIFSKPQAPELMALCKTKARGARIIVDFCDDHFEWMHYAEFLRMADVVTCPTEAMRERIKEFKRDAIVIPDPYEYPLDDPHFRGSQLLWFGHAVNKHSLERIMPDIEDYPLNVVSNFQGTIPWSYETMLHQFKIADIVILPATEKYKSANRAVESIRQGCFVVAEPHPSLSDIPGIWIGNIKEGIEWAVSNVSSVNPRILEAQKYVTGKYAPQTCINAWRSAIQSPIISDVEESVGMVG